MAELGFIKVSHYHKIKFYANSRLILLTLLLELHRTGSGQSVVGISSFSLPSASLAHEILTIIL